MYETDQNGVKYSLLYGQSSRVVTLAQLFDAEDRGAADEEHRAPAGQMLVFNARSRADALRYLSRDPATGTVPELFSASAKKSKKMFAVGLEKMLTFRRSDNKVI